MTPLGQDIVIIVFPIIQDPAYRFSLLFGVFGGLGTLGILVLVHIIPHF
jgi:hypothetical protein